MQKIGLCFCHGWGFSSSYWDSLLPYFENFPSTQWNLGYFGPPSLPQDLDVNTAWIAVGHSLGFRKLMESKIPWKGAIALQGFHHFLGSDPRLQKIRQRHLHLMILSWKQNPVATLNHFYKNCEVSCEVQSLDENPMALLGSDLSSLEDPGLFSLPQGLPFKAIGAQDDRVVTPALLEDQWPASSIVWSDTGGHGLGIFKSDFIAKTIHSLIREVSGS